VTYRLTPRAETDIEAIARHIADDNPSAALRWLDELERHLGNLGAMPGIGTPRPEVRPDLRLFAVGSYLILHRVVGDAVEVVRVVHGARQWQDLL
jgi:toxin ParE1/3/4